MTPKEKADELYSVYVGNINATHEQAIKCSLITVYEIIMYCDINKDIKFWQNVLHEINKL